MFTYNNANTQKTLKIDEVIFLYSAAAAVVYSNELSDCSLLCMTAIEGVSLERCGVGVTGMTMQQVKNEEEEKRLG